MIESIEDLDPLDRAVHRMKELEMVMEADGNHLEIEIQMIQKIVEDFEEYLIETKVL